MLQQCHGGRVPAWEIGRAMSNVDPNGYYASLGLNPFASADLIRAAFHRGAKQCHPDLDPSYRAKARFQVINEAYQVLSCPSQRASYDRLRWATALNAYRTDRHSGRRHATELHLRSRAEGLIVALSTALLLIGVTILA